MNWRWMVPAAFAFAAIEVVCGFAAYGSKTWDLSHTEVLTHWDAVREVCLVFVPIIAGVIVAFGALFLLTLNWAMGGRR